MIKKLIPIFIAISFGIIGSIIFITFHIKDMTKTDTELQIHFLNIGDKLNPNISLSLIDQYNYMNKYHLEIVKTINTEFDKFYFEISDKYKIHYRKLTRSTYYFSKISNNSNDDKQLLENVITKKIDEIKLLVRSHINENLEEKKIKYSKNLLCDYEPYENSSLNDDFAKINLDMEKLQYIADQIYEVQKSRRRSTMHYLQNFEIEKFKFSKENINKIMKSLNSANFDKQLSVILYNLTVINQLYNNIAYKIKTCDSIASKIKVDQIFLKDFENIFKYEKVWKIKRITRGKEFLLLQGFISGILFYILAKLSILYFRNKEN